MSISRGVPRRALLALPAFLLLVFVPPRVPAQTAPIPASATHNLLLSPEDTFLDVNETNYSTDTVVSTSTWPDHQAANAILMKFDLTALPLGAVIEKATLHLALVESDGNAESTYAVSAHKVLGRNPVVAEATGYTIDGVTAWSPSACCSNGGPLAQADISPAYDTRAVDKAAGYKAWTLTQMAQEWQADPATNFGLLLNADASNLGDSYRLFASMEHPDSALRPVLSLSYTMPPGSLALAPQDTYLDTNAANYSTNARLATYTWPDQQTANAILMKFNLSSLPAGAVVQEATLRLALVSSDAAPETTYTVTAQKVVGKNPDITRATGYTMDGATAWTANACCHDNVPLAQADISPAYDTRQIDKVPGYKVWTVTRMVQEWLAAPATNFGLLLNSDATKPRDRYRFFASMEAADPTLRPVLTIAYSVPSSSQSFSPQDTYLNLDSANYSTNARLATYTWPDSRPANAILMKFDLSSLPTGAVVHEAMLHLALVKSDGKPNPTYSVSAHKVVDKNPVIAAATGYKADGVNRWTPNTCCYNRVPLAQADISRPHDTREIDKMPGYKVWTVTSMVQEWLADPALNFGVLLNPDTTTRRTQSATLRDRYRFFASMEEPDTRLRPFLRIAYTLGTADTVPPSVALTDPASGATITGTVTVAANATDDVGVAGVQFKLDGVDLGVEDTTSPYSMPWNPVGVANGSHTLTAVARDFGGNVATSAGVTVTMANDTTPPSASVSAPAGGTTCTGTVMLTAIATDNVGVVGVRFKRNGVNVGAEDTTAPYSVPWNTASAADGSHTLTAVARDEAGNATTSASVNVTVANGNAVTLSSQDTFINLDATNQSANPQLRTYTWPANKAANAILMKFDLSAIPAGTVVSDATLQLALVDNDAAPDGTYMVTAHKIVGKNPVITAVTGYTADGATPWTPNACCFNNVPLAQADISTAYDTQAIDKTLGFKSWSITAMVEEWLDAPATNFGLLLNADTSKLADRYRSFASMEHADPNLRPSLRVTYTIPPPDPMPPTVFITAPTAGASVSGTVAVSATASDNVGVVSVQFQLDGVNLGAKDTTAPHSVSWNTATASAGAHTLTAIARDAAGNSTTSPGVLVTVVDVTGPVISGVAASAIAASSALISWTTNEVSDSQVEYGTTSAYGSTTTLNVSLLTSHTAALSGLSASTLYHYRVRSRDAAGMLSTSADFTFTTTGGGGSGVVFESYWDTALGNAPVAALRDGGRWTKEMDFGGAKILTVVPGGPGGHNALRVQQRGGSYGGFVQVDNVLPLSTDYYVRFYMRNDDTSGSGDHIVNPDIYNYANWTYIRKNGGPSSWRFVSSSYACESPGWPLVHWGPPTALSNGQWYRFEYYVHYVNSNHIQVHPRVYDAAGTLLFTDADFRQESYGSATWNGRSDWTLARYYAAGYSHCVSPTWMNDFAMGNNGQQGASDTGLYWYYGALQIRTDTWPGPLSGAGDTTPPTVSLTAPASGATVSGLATTVSATASDDVGVAGVQFKLDGATLGAEDTTAPYSISWNTTTAANGVHTLTAVARDAAGNQTTTAGRTVTVSNGVPPPGGIAALFPGDVGIENHAAVVFVEKFEEPALADLFARWTDVQNPTGQSFSADVPAGSPGSRSLDVSWTGGSQKTAGLYKLLTPGIDDTLHVRYYIKYPTTGKYRHDGIWMGGSNPPLTWPNPQAGVRPAGNDRFIASAEQVDDRSRFDHYNYWMNMRASGDGKFWGNMLLNDFGAQVNVGGWTCVEHMVKLNNPTTALNGEHAIWLDGVKVSHLGQGFPKGFWSNAIFTQDPGGSPFEGFRWRSDANLNLNWIWLEVYAPDDPAGFIGHIKYDHVVVATSYIGCLAP